MNRESRLLKAKAISSLRRTAGAFNDFDDDGRLTTVLLHLQHALEMLLKASLRERGVEIFDKTTGRTIGFKKCVSLSEQHLGLSKEQCGLLRTVDALRDDEQHYFGELSEGLLYLHVRAAFTLGDEILRTVFEETLADHLPVRVLPISTDPPGDLDVLIDEQYSQIRKLLQPGKRRRAEARAKIRGLLAMEAHGAEDIRVSESDVNRVERAMKAKKNVETVFPRLRGVSTSFAGTGINLTVHFTKREGAPVHFVPADDPRDTAAVRQVDLQKRYRYSTRELAAQVGLTPPRSVALRRHLQLDDDEDSHHVFVFGSQRIPGFSDRAIELMREAIGSVDMDEVWREHGPRRRPR